MSTSSIASSSYIQRPLPPVTTRIEFSLYGLKHSSSRIALQYGYDSGRRVAYDGEEREREREIERDDQEEHEVELHLLSNQNDDNRSKCIHSEFRPGWSSNGIIPKPPGEPGGPGSGGYCIQKVLTQKHGWSLHSCDRLQKTVRSEARRHLDMTASYRCQNQDAVRKVCETVMKEGGWPVLKDYDDCWPVRSMLKLALKYGSEAARRANLRKEIKNIRRSRSTMGWDVPREVIEID